VNMCSLKLESSPVPNDWQLQIEEIVGAGQIKTDVH
jgi:hypothetical protein